MLRPPKQPKPAPPCLHEQGLGAGDPGPDRILQARYQRAVDSNDPKGDHGRPANRGKWSMAGFDAGDPAACNTYLAASPLVS